MKHLIVSLLLAAFSAHAADTEPPCEVVAFEVKSGSLRGKSDVPLHVVGGAYLAEESFRCLGKTRYALETEVAVLRSRPAVNPTSMTVATSVAFVLGAAVGFFLRGAR